MATIHGRDDDYANNTTLDLNTKLNASRVSGALAKNDPVGAQAALDRARKDETIDAGTADKLQQQIQSATYNKTSVAEAAKIYNDPKNKDATAEDLQKQAQAKADSLFPDDAVFKDKLVQQTEILRSRTQTFKRADEYDRATALNGAVYGVGAQDGKLPTSLDDLSSDARAAYDNANPRTQAATLRRISANAKGDYMPTPENQARYNYWRGVLTDPTATADERDAALAPGALDDLHMPAPQARQLMDLRNKLYKNTMADHALPHAMSVIAPMLSPELGLNKSRNPDDYHRFIGAFGEALTQAADQKKAPLNDKEIKELGANMLQKVQVPGRLWGTNTTENFRVDVPSEYADKVKKLYTSQGEPEPDPDKIQQLYTTDRLKAMSNGFTTLFGKKATTRVPQ